MHIYAVWSGHLLFINIYYSIHWFFKRKMKALIRSLDQPVRMCMPIYKSQIAYGPFLCIAHHLGRIISVASWLYFIWFRSYGPDTYFEQGQITQKVKKERFVILVHITPSWWDTSIYKDCLSYGSAVMAQIRISNHINPCPAEPGYTLPLQTV